MANLQIPSHSRRVTSFAIAGLAVLAAAAFSFGLEHQVRHTEGPAPFPAGQAAGLRAYVDNIPEATPARELEVAADTRVRHHAPAAEILDVPDPATPPAADAATAVDASATAPDPKPAAEPSTSEQPPT